MPTNRIQIKICGLTDPDNALECVELGADAIGCVFYPKSPRNLTNEQAKRICAALPSNIPGVGVFVNEDFSAIMEKVNRCGLKAVQLHGNEKPELVSSLRKEKLTVIKALFDGGSPAMDDAGKFDASAFLIEAAKGTLPGGNAMTWNWENAARFDRPFALAGGLSPKNVLEAVSSCRPHALDVSSGVEASPGRKDIEKVAAFMRALSEHAFDWETKQIFQTVSV